MTLTLLDVQHAISELSIRGIKRIYTSADMARENYRRDLPLLMPDPAAPLASSHDRRLTIGTSALADPRSGWVRTRILNYVCLVKEVGEGRKPGDGAETLSQCLDAVENAFCAFAVNGVHRVDSVRIGNVGIVQDASSAGVNSADARQYLGFTIELVIISSY